MTLADNTPHVNYEPHPSNSATVIAYTPDRTFEIPHDYYSALKLHPKLFDESDISIVMHSNKLFADVCFSTENNSTIYTFSPVIKLNVENEILEDGQLVVIPKNTLWSVELVKITPASMCPKKYDLSLPLFKALNLSLLKGNDLTSIMDALNLVRCKSNLS